MRRNHYKTAALVIATLMLSGIGTLLITAEATARPYEFNFAPLDFTWQTFDRNMNVTTFVSPDGSREELWHILNSAQESIYVEVFGINNPYILDLIHELHTTKPTLDFKFLLGHNSIGYYSPNDHVAYNLTQLGLPVRWTNSDDFTYAHQKFVIIDNETTVVHSGNWAKTSFPQDGHKANREWSIAMADTEVTGYFRDVFDYDWSRGTDYNEASDGIGSPLTRTGTTSTNPNLFATPGQFSGQMRVTPISSPDTSLQGILYCINSAQATLDIQIPYFTSVGEASAVDQVIDAILAAKARGVTVRVISEEEYDFQTVADLFVEHDIPVVWQDTRWFTANHNKGILVDGRTVLISSINYSNGSIMANREAGVIIENQDVAQWYQDVFDFDWGIASCDVMDEVNVYWDPNIPTSSSTINVTVYALDLYPDVDEVQLDVKIGAGAWSNNTITANVYESAEGDLENYFYVISPQADGTNITVVGRIRVGATWHIGVPMVIRVRNSIAPPTTTSPPPTTTTTPPPVTTPDFLTTYGPYIIAGVIAVLCGGGGFVARQRGYLGGRSGSSGRKRKTRMKRS
ncbi:MAG: phospholipase D-like domain-containing protein [Candidatus Thorarchaeota archaeon]|jgi:phosphatidylserine/phosphatidylglycerophosphate/cardiolipin synthase-like enzyme